MVSFGSLTAEIGSGVWGTPANFNRLRVLALLLHRCRSIEVIQALHDVWPFLGLVHYIHIFGGSCPLTEFWQVQNSLCVQVLRSPALLHSTWVVGVSQTVALNRGCHLYLAGRPSHWASTHILVIFCFGFVHLTELESVNILPCVTHLLSYCTMVSVNQMMSLTMTVSRDGVGEPYDYADNNSVAWCVSEPYYDADNDIIEYGVCRVCRWQRNCWHMKSCCQWVDSWSVSLQTDISMSSPATCVLLLDSQSMTVFYCFLNYLRQGRYVIVVCLSVCLLATLHKNFQTDLHEIFREGWPRAGSGAVSK